DRLSAFDVVLPDPIPGKGEVLTQVARFWFARTEHLVKNHLVDMPLEDVVKDPAEREAIGDRWMIVRRLKALPVEAIVRGYIIGSGWKDYQATGAVCGIALPEGMEMAQQLPEPLFTPSTKAEVGDHDENISFEQAQQVLGEEIANKVRDLSLTIYKDAAAYALERGIIIADTKFEFGLDEDGEIILIDEALTPDSSRFWPLDEWQQGQNPPSFDKQFVRDYLETLDWDKTAPGPTLPAEILQQSADRYRQAQRLLTEA
ncbi:MAG: phosphoribosylaminoimidazolesuccinocarboxamide synthase, partial [Gammaproteobacteria bacterium]|nr:phosphoribosylaminoimidazolesuccinocarboxamide synthase [Gammaproteobacteria bacterium]